jgi:hypothetical protein
MEFSRVRCAKGFGVVVLLGIIGYSSYLLYYFCSYQWRLCTPIRNCTYNVIDKYHDGTYFYQYVVNSQYKCLYPCSNREDITSCPINGSKCHITDAVIQECISTGFAHLFDCQNLAETVMLPGITMLVCFVSLILTGLIILSLTTDWSFHGCWYDLKAICYDCFDCHKCSSPEEEPLLV